MKQFNKSHFSIYATIFSDVGYAKNIENRLNQHNSNKGAKSTKGRYWKLIYKKNFKNKSRALKYEYFLKKNTKLRNDIKLKFIKNYG